MRYLIIFSYDGSKYYGYQKQLKKKTIQGEIEKALKKISKSKINISSSGRTDRGVHAINQTATFDMNIKIEPKNLQKALNSILPDDIYIKDCQKVNDDFHARFNVIKKEYIYKINIGEYNPIEKDYVYQYNNDLDIKKMKEAIKEFLGEHNFKSFAKAKDLRDSYVRTIYSASIDLKDNYVIITFIGNGFLRYMVRNMVGLLIEIGEGKYSVNDISKILAAQNRQKAGKTAPPEGLYLNKVYYSDVNSK